MSGNNEIMSHSLVSDESVSLNFFVLHMLRESSIKKTSLGFRLFSSIIILKIL